MQLQPVLRKIAVFFLVLYTAGSLYITLRGVLGLPLFNFATPLLTSMAFIFAVLHAWSRLGWKQALLLLLLSTAISLLFESVGVATGLVYGPYHYTEKLGPRFLGLVPYLIPVAWFMMMYPSFLMASRFQPVRMKRWARILFVAALGALVMTAWDTVMDPMMVKAGHWIWEIQGIYFGIPLQNYWGWWLTTFCVFAVFQFLRPRTLDTLKPVSSPGLMLRNYDALAVVSYAVTGLSNAIAAFLMGMPGPALVGLVLMGIFVLAWILRR